MEQETKQIFREGDIVEALFEAHPVVTKGWLFTAIKDYSCFPASYDEACHIGNGFVDVDWVNKFSDDFRLIKRKEMFSKKDLKTGYILETFIGNKVEFTMVLLGTINGNIAIGDTWFPLDSYADEELFGNMSGLNINKVYRLKTNQDHALAVTKGLKDQILHCAVVWERKPETEQQKQIRELGETIKKAQQQLEQLKQIEEK